MERLIVGHRRLTAFLPTALSLLCVITAATLAGCNHSGAATGPSPQTAAPPVVGNWTGTQSGITDLNKNPFQFTAQFTPAGTFTLSGSWQGRNGPAGQTMSGSYTQSGSSLTLNVTGNQSLAAGQTLALPGLTLSGTVSADGKRIDVAHGIAAAYVLTRS